MLFLLLLLIGACRQVEKSIPEVLPISEAVFAEEVQIPSDTMQQSFGAYVLLPDCYRQDSTRHFPVVYLLHGYSGKYSNWYEKMPTLQDYASQHEIIIVNPDGQFGSWYIDSPMDTSWRFETYIAKEVPEWIDTHYRTVPLPEGRAITGLSMGGHGALYLGLNHQDFFGAAGSMSGGVDLKPFPNNWDLQQRIGTQQEHPENWTKYSVVDQLDLLKPGKGPALIIDCGVDDFFYAVNLDLHQKLLDRKIPHDFISRPGEHNWPYWENAVVYQLLFFNRYFAAGGF
ncbi:MAG: hypothetical protein DHS20C18_30460 [Saprospiraceae bacterium]|nr:MAG: hypothetical protein DHS20C18_30460 [Saprospiraceae bacterium]